MAILRLVRAAVQRQPVVDDRVLLAFVQRGQSCAIGPVRLPGVLVARQRPFNRRAKLQRLIRLARQRRCLQNHAQRVAVLGVVAALEPPQVGVGDIVPPVDLRMAAVAVGAGLLQQLQRALRLPAMVQQEPRRIDILERHGAESAVVLHRLQIAVQRRNAVFLGDELIVQRNLQQLAPLRIDIVRELADKLFHLVEIGGFVRLPRVQILLSIGPRMLLVPLIPQLGLGRRAVRKVARGRIRHGCQLVLGGAAQPVALHQERAIAGIAAGRQRFQPLQVQPDLLAQRIVFAGRPHQELTLPKDLVVLQPHRVRLCFQPRAQGRCRLAHRGQVFLQHHAVPHAAVRGIGSPRRA